MVSDGRLRWHQPAVSNFNAKYFKARRCCLRYWRGPYFLSSPYILNDPGSRKLDIQSFKNSFCCKRKYLNTWVNNTIDDTIGTQGILCCKRPGMQISQCLLQRAGDSTISKFPAIQKAVCVSEIHISCPNISRYLLLQKEGSTEAAVREAIQPSGPDASCLARFYWGGRCSGADLIYWFLFS